MHQNLEPCLFCGSADVNLEPAFENEFGVPFPAYVSCEGCGARGSEAVTDEDAITRWNLTTGRLRRNLIRAN